ncbi:tRNA-dihydrouridine(47) synthase [NAD(P)(+)]-like protein [Balamuthia mandrillaris]
MRKRRKLEKEAKLCFSIATGQEKCPRKSCPYSHDPELFLKQKEPDIGDYCYIFATTGHCPYGLACRFASAHLKDNANFTDEERMASPTDSLSTNNLKKEVQVQLRSRRYPLPRATAALQALKALNTIPDGEEEEQEQEEANKTEKDHTKETENEKEKEKEKENDKGTEHKELMELETKDGKENEQTGSSPSQLKPSVLDKPSSWDTEVPLRKEEKKKVNFKDQLYLAPLTTVGNLPFRRICKRFGVDITCGEMALATNLLQGHISEWALIKRHPCEDVFGAQIAGAHPHEMTRCAEVLANEMELDFIDINAGCPIDLIVNKGMGSAMLERKNRIRGVLRGMSSVVSCPVTIKIRIGKSEKAPNAHKLMPLFADWGADAITLHGRSRLQRYSREADWGYIQRCVQTVNVPVIGNGDIYSWQEAEEQKAKSGVSSIMVARGALIKPWIFTELKERRDWDISSSERFEMLRDFTNYGLLHWGSDTKGVERTRDFLLQWLSFLFRYVPVGLLEKLPPRLKDRPPAYYGRNDLETLMSSPNVSDWIKISELLLGRVPSNFSFTPKHGSHAYSLSEG